ncbi:MAG: methyltransferase [Verrucomicrobiales bacterium]|nr:methyltransferase [Verrucomicrobiales bacterium]
MSWLNKLSRLPEISPGEFDPPDLPALLKKENPVILDIGCNNGGQSALFLKLFPKGSVYSFEPDPRAREAFRKKVTDPRAKLFDIAISAQDGTTEFYVSDGVPSAEWKQHLPAGWDLSGSIKKPKKHLELHPWCKFEQRIQVTTKKLDTWCNDEGVKEIDFIWADVQGAEVDLIKGGEQALRRTRYLYTEYNDKELYEGQADLRTLLKLLPDFEVVHRYANDVLLRNKLIA